MWCTFAFLVIAFVNTGQSQGKLIPPVDSAVPANTIAALRSFIEEKFEKRARSLIISYNALDKKGLLAAKDVLSQLLPKLRNISVIIGDIFMPQDNFNQGKFNLIIVDGYQSLLKLDPELATKKFDDLEYYLIYFMQPTIPQDEQKAIYKIFKYFWKNFSINVSLLYEANAHKAEIYTYFPFLNESNCKQLTVQRINVYTGYWHNSTEDHLFVPRNINLKKCPLKIATRDAPPHVILLPNTTRPTTIDGIEGKLVQTLAEKLNFSIKLIKVPDVDSYGRVYPNGTTTGIVKMLYEKKLDFGVGFFTFTAPRAHLLTAIYPYYQEPMVYMIVVSAKRYSSFEILSQVFDGTTWLCLCLSLPLAMILVSLVHRLRECSYLARLMTNPTQSSDAQFGVVSILLGSTLSRSPRFTFNRFTVFCWFIYGIIIRTAYQTLLCTMLQTNLYYKPPATLADLHKSGYKFIATEVEYAFLQYINSSIFDNNSMTQVTVVENTIALYKLLEDNAVENWVGVSSLYSLTNHITTKQMRGIYYVLPENVVSRYLTIYFPKHYYLSEQFDSIISNLKNHGLLAFWASKYMNPKYLNSPKSVDGKSLNLDDLWGIFILVFILHVLACVVFLLEVLWVKIWKRRFAQARIM